MEKKNKYYVVRDKALPEVLQKVVEVKRLLEADKNMTVQEAAEQVGLSRSSFYKYKDDILYLATKTNQTREVTFYEEEIIKHTSCNSHGCYNACRMWIQWGTAGNHTGNGQ